MFTIAGFYKPVAQNAVYDSLNAVTDQSQTISSNGKFIFPQRYKIVQAAVMGTALTNARLDAPSLRNLVLPQIYPVIVAAAPPDQPPISWLGDYGPTLQTNEEFTIDVSHAGAGADDIFAAVFLQDQGSAAPGGPAFTLYGTATITHVKGSWVLGPLTLDQTLPSGRYAVVGFDAVAANAFAVRLVFPGLNQWRPGVIANASYGRRSWMDRNRMGRMGAWGEFFNTAQPQVEVLGHTAGSASVAVVIDVIKVG